MVEAAQTTRNSAFLLHLAISFVIAAAALAVVFLVWYPAPFSEIQGVSKLLLVLIGVDVVIGPVLTLIIFNPAKGWRLLRLDLTVIAVLQIAALGYGVVSIYEGRPAFLIFNVDRFNVVQAQDVDRDSLERARKKGTVEGLPYLGPQTFASQVPKLPAEAQDLLFQSISGGADLPELPHLYVPYEEDRQQVLKRVRPMAELKSLNDLSDAQWKETLSKFELPESRLRYLPLMGKAKEAAVVVNAETGEILDILVLLPKWSALTPEEKSEKPESETEIGETPEGAASKSESAVISG